MKNFKPPLAILKEQALVLEELTNRVLTAKSFFYGGVYEFKIKCPALNNYSYVLFNFYMEKDYYPVKIGLAANQNLVVCDNQEEFEGFLRNLLEHSETKRVIAGLLSQIKWLGGDNEND